MGREFRCPLDIDLLLTPSLNTAATVKLFKYLRDTSTDSKFVLSVLQVLLEERRNHMQDTNNEGKIECKLRVGDVVKVDVQVQSIVNRGIVGNLSYRVKGPFIITADLGHNSFEVHRYDDPLSAKRKYKNTELYLLPPALFPSTPLDTIDQHYLDNQFAPIVNPLKGALKVELYNDK